MANVIRDIVDAIKRKDWQAANESVGAALHLKVSERLAQERIETNRTALTEAGGLFKACKSCHHPDSKHEGEEGCTVPGCKCMGMKEEDEEDDEKPKLDEGKYDFARVPERRFVASVTDAGGGQTITTTVYGNSAGDAEQKYVAAHPGSKCIVRSELREDITRTTIRDENGIVKLAKDLVAKSPNDNMGVSKSWSRESDFEVHCDNCEESLWLEGATEAEVRKFVATHSKCARLKFRDLLGVNEAKDEEHRCEFCGTTKNVKKVDDTWLCKDCDIEECGPECKKGKVIKETKMPAAEVQRVYDETGSVSETEMLCGVTNLKVNEKQQVVSFVTESREVTRKRRPFLAEATNLKVGDKVRYNLYALERLRNSRPQEYARKKSLTGEVTGIKKGGAGSINTMALSIRWSDGTTSETIDYLISPITESMMEADMPFKQIRQPLPPISTRRTRINNALADIGKTYWPRIPLKDMFDILQKNGFDPVQEDGTPWSGLLLGEKGEAKIDLVDQATGKPANRWLVMTWYRMPSGRYEIVAYIS